MIDVLITGASRGIGFALATKYLQEGYRVFCASRNLDSLQTLKQTYHHRCLLVQLDLQSEESISSAVAEISDHSAALQIVIHNAGALINKPFQTITKQELQLCYDVNVLGPYLLMQKILPILDANAHIVFLSSMGGFQGTQKFPGLTAYSSSKAAAAGLSECLQEEFKETSLTFNCLCLGAVQTEMLEEAFPGYIAPVNPKQISEFIFHFCNTANLYMKGKIIPVSLSTP